MISLRELLSPCWRCIHRLSELTFAELKLLVGAIYTNYTTKIVDDEGIEQKDTYTSGPKGNKLILEFQKV
jgi:hypothetical protein